MDPIHMTVKQLDALEKEALRLRALVEPDLQKMFPGPTEQLTAQQQAKIEQAVDFIDSEFDDSIEQGYAARLAALLLDVNVLLFADRIPDMDLGIHLSSIPGVYDGYEVKKYTALVFRDEDQDELELNEVVFVYDSTENLCLKQDMTVTEEPCCISGVDFIGKWLFATPDEIKTAIQTMKAVAQSTPPSPGW